MKNNLYIEPNLWPKELFEKVQLSIRRYFNYINGDHIRHSEITKYKKEWLSNALGLVPDTYLKKNEILVRKLF